jgi:hypothetical protein
LPYISRTSVNIIEEASALFELMEYYKFKELVLWHSDSTVGGYLSSNFFAGCALLCCLFARDQTSSAFCLSVDTKQTADGGGQTDLQIVDVITNSRHFSFSHLCSKCLVTGAGAIQ